MFGNGPALWIDPVVGCGSWRKWVWQLANLCKRPFVSRKVACIPALRLPCPLDLSPLRSSQPCMQPSCPDTITTLCLPPRPSRRTRTARPTTYHVCLLTPLPHCFSYRFACNGRRAVKPSKHATTVSRRTTGCGRRPRLHTPAGLRHTAHSASSQVGDVRLPGIATTRTFSERLASIILLRALTSARADATSTSIWVP
jgi:hypothetical protein